MMTLDTCLLKVCVYSSIIICVPYIKKCPLWINNSRINHYYYKQKIILKFNAKKQTSENRKNVLYEAL